MLLVHAESSWIDGLNKGAISRKALIHALAVGVWNVDNKCIKTGSRLIVIRKAMDDVEVDEAPELNAVEKFEELDEPEPEDMDHLVQVLIAFVRNM